MEMWDTEHYKVDAMQPEVIYKKLLHKKPLRDL